MTLKKLEGFFEDHVARLHAQGIAKSDAKVIVSVRPPQGGFSERCLLEGYGERAFLRMNSNSYLGLSLHPRLIEAEARTAELFGTGLGCPSRKLVAFDIAHLFRSGKSSTNVGYPPDD